MALMISYCLVLQTIADVIRTCLGPRAMMKVTPPPPGRDIEHVQISHLEMNVPSLNRANRNHSFI